MIYFTSDIHFGHANIIKYCNRPFTSVEEMDAILTHNWNARIKSDDHVYFLGDFAMRGKRAHRQGLLDQLHGIKFLVRGNHDDRTTRKLQGWQWVKDYHEIVMGDRKVVLCHYPMHTWNKAQYGSIMLHGHSHGAVPGTRQRLDVGVDCWSYHPVTFDEIEVRSAGAPPFKVEHYAVKGD